jgi:hypothetical protein
MATFKAVVMKHQQRSDKRYPISIRITNNRKVGYISTGLYAENTQINKKSFEMGGELIVPQKERPDSPNSYELFSKHVVSFFKGIISVKKISK